MANKQFDVIVIGGGPGGYIAAIRAAQLGFNVACVDEWKNANGGPALGGTCTNVGCIPSKALLQSSEHYEQAGHTFADHGINVSGLSLDIGKMMARKDHVVKQNNDGITYLFKKNKITSFHGRASFVKTDETGYELKVVGAAGEEAISGKHIIVATGSNARALPGAPFDEENILSNDGALRVGAVPKKLALIGAGVIGLEMGSVWRRLGADVTVLEGLPTFLGAVDEQIAKEAKKAFDKQGLKIELGVKVGEIKTGKKGVSIAWTNAKGEAQTSPTPSASTLKQSASSSTSAVRWWSTTSARPTCRTSGRSATSCAARCWRTRPKKRAWPWPSALPASMGTSTSIPFHGLSTHIRKLPGSGRPSNSSRPKAEPTRPVPSRSWRTAAHVRWATPPAWSSSLRMRPPTRSSACTWWARKSAS